jgi:hypothetical protein
MNGSQSFSVVYGEKKVLLTFWETSPGLLALDIQTVLSPLPS